MLFFLEFLKLLQKNICLYNKALTMTHRTSILNLQRWRNGLDEKLLSISIRVSEEECINLSKQLVWGNTLHIANLIRRTALIETAKIIKENVEEGENANERN